MPYIRDRQHTAQLYWHGHSFQLVGSWYQELSTCQGAGGIEKSGSDAGHVFPETLKGSAELDKASPMTPERECSSSQPCNPCI
ncbi:hypothetical protein Y1Q_0001238 [Alligator mississippiensis]|uniref:Uncharacterized protein n=1 Tax=Alligator mississippiensis TaxID=8496 RepID=A0A151PEU2_ALLMI|nr:hypothetical protein Y1Q_0001238 [Alligator mississippiensis]